MANDGNNGYIGLFRDLLEKPIWQQSTPEQKTVLITLLLMANHKEREWEWGGKQFKASPGQFVTSLENIQKKSGKGISQQNIRTALKRFEKYEFLTNKSTKTGRMITIVNWGVYQVEKLRTNKAIDNQLTNDSQTPNKDLTPNKNDKKDKKEKKVLDIYADTQFKIPTIEEVKIYCLERKNNVDANKWHDFYSSKGWMVGKNKMKDWKAAVRTWEHKDNQGGQARYGKNKPNEVNSGDSKPWETDPYLIDILGGRDKETS